MTRVLFDTNVLLDVLLEREPHLIASTLALDAATRDGVDGLIAAHAVTTIAYVLQRHRGSGEARRAIAHVLSHLAVAAVTDAGVRLALVTPAQDFEDAVSAAAASEAGVDLIVTRDIRHLAFSSVPAVLPETFLASL